MIDKSKKGSVKVKTPSAMSWFKNVGKSLGYTSMDLVNEMMPATIDFTTSNVETVKELYTDLRRMKSQGKRVVDEIIGSEYADIARSSIQNAMKDIKSGKIYNKDRQDKVFQDGDDEFGMSDFNFDESDDTSSKQQPIHINNIEGNINKNNPMVKAVDRQTQAMLSTAQVTNDLGVSLATTTLLSNKKIGTGIMQGLNGINNNLALLVNFQSESMTKYISASLVYYEQNLKVLGDTLLEIQKSSPKPTEPGKRKDDPLDMALLSKGGLNLKGYGNMVWKQVGNAIDSNMFLSPIKSMLQDKDTLKFLAASPLSFISTKIVTALIPNMLKSAMTDMDKSFQGFFPAMLMKINRLAYKSDNPIMQLFGQVFGANVKTKSSVDMSKFNKGPVPFDGYVKKSITDVIPTYLRKILSALTGKEEMGFDYDKGTFGSVYQMKKDFDDQKERTVLNQFSDAISEIKDRANSFYIEDGVERNKFYKDIDSFFINLAKSNYLVNPTSTKDKNGNAVDELADVFKFKGDQQKFFRQLILSLPKNMQSQMFGMGVINARREQNRFMMDAEENPLKNNANNIFNEAGIDGHLTRDTKDPSKFKLKKGGGLLPSDAYDLNSLDYLRDIKKILLKGIIVFPNQSTNTDPLSPFVPPTHSSSGLKRMKQREDIIKERNRKNNTITPSTETQIGQRMNHGQRTIDSLSDSGLGEGDFQAQIGTYVSERDKVPGPNQGNNIFKWAGKFFKGDAQERYNMIREKVNDLFQAPVKLLSGVFKKIDLTMYEMVFGKQGTDENTSFFSKTLSLMKTKFETFSTWMKTEIFLPIKDALFGKDGFITKLKNSEMVNTAKGKLSKLANYLFGDPGGANGARENGVFSQTANSLMDIWDGAKYYFTGKGYTNRAGDKFSDNNSSVFGELKSMFKDFKGNLKEYLFGKKDTNDPTNNTKGVFSGIVSSIGKGFQNFSDAMFGPKRIGGKDNQNHIVMDELFKNIKKKAPKSLAYGLLGGTAGLLFGGKLGLLGSLLLPGGPIGGAVVATTMGFLSQSDRFNNWLFGPKDINGTRIGGFVSKKTTDFLKKNKVGIIGGASMGAAKSLLTSFGLLPSFFLPGGIVGGAILGVGTSLLVRSERFQKAMFGEKDADGKRQGGVVDKLFGQFRKGKNKNLFGNMGAGAAGGAALGMITSKFGLMGAMLLPGGPIGGALLGAAAGIALSSDKWRKALFGEFDADTQLRKGGLFGKFINWTKLEVLAPLKLKFGEINLNIQKWFGESIANPFLNAIDPLKHEMTLMIRSLKDTFVQGWKNFQTFLGTSFEKFVGKPFGQFMNDNVMKPLKSFLSTLLNGIGRIFGPLLSAPLRAMEGLSEGLMARHKEQGVAAYRKKRGFWGSVKDSIFNRQAIEDARNSSEGAPYAKELEIAKAKRASDTAAKYNEKKAILDAKWDKLNRRRGVGSDNDYDNFDRNGNVIVDVYRTHGSEGNPIESANTRIAEANNMSNPNQSNKSTFPVVSLDDYRQSKSSNIPTTQSGPTQSRPTLQLVPPINNSQQDNGPTPIMDNSSNKTNTTTLAPQVSKSGKTSTLEFKPQIMNDMASDIKIIAQEVKGQLDGVGSNVFKIRKLLQQQSGIGDEDLSGSSNRDRIGFLGKIKRALYKPFDTAKELLMKPIRYVGDKLSTLGTTIVSVGKAIVKIPVDIAKGMWNFSKEVLNIGKETLLALVKLPLAIVKTVGFALQTVAESLKIVGPAIGESLKGVAKLFSGTLGLVSHSLIGFGKGLGEILLGVGQGLGMITKGIGEAVGKAISGTVGALFKMVPMVTDFMFKSASAITDFTFNVVTSVGQKLLSIGDSLFEIVTSPIKFLAGSIGKMAGWKSEVIIAGGSLDLVKEVRVMQINGSARTLAPTGTDGVTHSGNLTPMPVRIVSSDTLPVRLVSTTPSPNSGSSTRGKVLPFRSISNGMDQITNSMLGAMNIFDTKEDKEDAARAEEAAQEAELNADQKQVSRRTASFTIAQNQAREDREFTQNSQIQEVSLLSNIAGLIKGQRADWLGIFGKAGLITTAALMALPYLKKLFNWFIGKTDSPTDGDHSDTYGNPITDMDTAEHVGKGLVYGTRLLNKKLVEPMVAGGRKMIKTGTKVVNPIVNTGKKVLTKILGKPSSVVKESGLAVIEDSTKMANDVKGSQIAKIQKTIQEMMSKLFAYLGEKCPQAKKGFGAISATVTKVFTKEVLGKTLPKWLAGTARLAGSAATLGLLDATWVTYGLVTGWFEASHLFRVHPEQTDYMMKSISSAMKGMLNFSWFFLINIANDVFVSATQGNTIASSITGGTGFLEMIANYLYAAWAGDDKGIKLENNQGAFKKELEEYNIENNKNLTPDEYNALTNPTIADKVVGGIKNGASYVGGKISQGASYVGNGIVNNTKWVANNMPIVGDFINNDTVKKNLNVTGNGTISTGMRIASGISGGLESASLGILDSEKTAKTIYGIGVTANNFIDTLGINLGKTSEKISTETSTKLDSITGSFRDTWAVMTSIVDEKVAEIKKDVGEKVDLISGSFRDTWSVMTSIVDEKVAGIKKDINEKTEPIVKAFRDTWVVISGYVDDAITPIKSFFKNIADGMKNTFGKIGDKVKNGWNSVVNLFNGNADLELKDANFSTNTTSNVRRGGMGGFNGGFGEAPSTVNNFSYYSQADDRWANVPYDYSPGKGHSPNPAMEKRGCGPTSAAMVVSQLTGKQYTPVQMAKIAQEDGYSTNQGTSWGYFNDIAKKFSMQTTQIDPSSNKGTVRNWLDNGVPIVLSGIRPGSSASENSPFTSAGHFVVAVGNDGPNKVMINDPRGEKYSHSYNMNTVMNEAKQAWGFKYGGGPIPTPSTDTPSSSPSVAKKEGPFSGEDLFSKLSELMGIYTENAFFGRNDQLSWGTDDTGSPIQAPSSTAGIDFIPKNLQDAILKKTAEETIKHESNGNYTFAKNDINGSTGQSISPSIGALQWRGGYAKQLMQNMAAKLPGNSEANYFANKVNWNSNSPWSNSEQTRLQNFLTSNYGITKQVEDDMIMNHVRDTNLSQVYKYGVVPKKIADPRSIVFLGDFANTGPANISPFMSAYSKTSQTGKSEFDHLYNEFKAKSYWGKHSGIYSGRMSGLYSDLSDWDPEQGGYGAQHVPGGFGELTDSITSKLTSNPDNGTVMNNLSFPSFSSGSSPAVRSYMSNNQQASNTGSFSDELLSEAIHVLQSIASNTGNTTDGIRSLSNMKIQVDVSNNQPPTSGNTSQNNIIIAPGQTSTSINPFMGMGTKKEDKESRNYEVAKTIARGRIT